MKYDLIEGDCLQLMRDIPDASVDMILCDLPYGTTQNKWDSVIPFEPLWKEYWRICTGAVVLTAQNLFTARLIMSASDFYRYSLIWEKSKAGGFLNAKRMPLQAHEDICVFYKKTPVYRPQMEVGKPYVKKAVTDGDGKNYGKFSRAGQISVNEGQRYPRSVLKFSNANNSSVHPTQKPVALMEYLIRTYTDEGMVVLDNCMGSGTTGVACANTGRRFIGMEMNADYFDIACDRVEKAYADALA